MEDIGFIILGLSYPIFFGIIIAIIIFAGGGNINLRTESSTGRAVLYRNRKKISDISRSEIQNLYLGTYTVQRSKGGSTTYYSLGIGLQPEFLKRLVDSHPKIQKDVDMNKNGVRIFNSKDEIKVRREAESLAKFFQIPLVSVSGEIREWNHLDLSFSERMRDKMDTSGFPPIYKSGDSYEIRTLSHPRGFHFVQKKRNMFILFPFFLFLLVFLGFFGFIFGSDPNFGVPDSDEFWIEWVFLSIPLLIFGSLLAYFLIQFLKKREIVITEKEISINGKKIPTNSVEEVYFSNMSLKLVTDEKIFTFSLIFQSRFDEMEDHVLQIKKALLLAGSR
jgi:hypothetical protein